MPLAAATPRHKGLAGMPLAAATPRHKGLAGMPLAAASVGPVFHHCEKEEKMPRTASTKDAAFRLYAPQAKKVSVAGSFNNWSAAKLMARKDSRGNWMAATKLRPGRYEYKFVVDGNWINDPQCTWMVNNSLGSQNCVIEIR